MRERLAVAIVAFYGCLYLLLLRGLFSQDGWLALVAGRDIAQHGLPGTDGLTAYTHGVRWVDQQWLAQLAMYELERLGGLTLVALAHVGVAMAVVGIAVAVARRGGASPLAILVVALAAFVPFSFVLAAIRTQIFGALAFAAVLAILVRDARQPSARVWLALPILALWANLHGSVLLGATLVALRGATLIIGDTRMMKRGAGLMVGALAAAFASPYLPHLPEYYHHTAFNPQFSKFVGEWRRATPNLPNAPFYLLVVAAVVVFARRRRALTSFEWLVLLVTAVAGVSAVRNEAWFAMAAIMSLPTAFPASRPERSGPRALGLVIVAVPCALLLTLFVIAGLRAGSWFRSAYPDGPLHAVERSARNDPEARVFADVRFGDWLLWRAPWLAGRVAYDARYELLSSRQIDLIREFNDRVGPRWPQAASGYKIVLLDDGRDGPRTRALLSRPGSRLVYGGRGGTVISLGG